MNVNFKNLKLKQKMIFTIIPTLLLIFIVFGSVVYVYVRDMMIAEGKDEVNLMVNDFSSQMEAELLMYLDIKKQINIIFSRFESMDANFRRKFYTDLVFDLVGKNEKLLSV
jgi:hypothetical protein